MKLSHFSWNPFTLSKRQNNPHPLQLSDIELLDELAKAQIIDADAYQIALSQLSIHQTPVLDCLLQAHLIGAEQIKIILNQKNCHCLSAQEIDYTEITRIQQYSNPSIHFQTLVSKELIPISEHQQILTIASSRPYCEHQQHLAETLIDPTYVIKLCYVMDISIKQIWQQLQWQQFSIEEFIAAIHQPINAHASNTDTSSASPSFSLLNESETAIIRLVEMLLNEALQKRASDIHFDVHANFVEQRLRIDATLITQRRFSHNLWQSILIRFKVLAKVDMSENIKPQDGSFQFDHGNDRFDLRFSSMPTIHGESLVIRVSAAEKAPSCSRVNNQHSSIDSLQQLGLASEQIQTLQQLIRQPSGIILVGGPTGSGKTTTLYALLSELDVHKLNIMALEDPVEHPVFGIRQTSVRADLGIDFASGIRAMLRQDPDIILIGEIRDQESAELAIKASLTGHLVLATIHAAFVEDIPRRMQNLLTSEQLFLEQCLALVSQRLIRLICQACYGIGCHSCSNSGYQYRQAVIEISQPQWHQDRIEFGQYTSIHQQCQNLIQTNQTTNEEIKRVLGTA